MDAKKLAKALRDTAQSASNAIASNVSGPVDIISSGLRYAGLPIPSAPIGGSEWMAQKGLTSEVQMGAPRIIGETLGMAGPAIVAAKAPQVASGLINLGKNAMAPSTLNKQTGAIVWHGSPHKFDKFDASKIGTGEGAQAYGNGLYLAENKAVASGYKDKLSPDTINRIQADEYTIAGDPQFILKIHDASGKVTKTPYLSPSEFDKWVGPDAAKMVREKGDGDYKNLNIDFGNLYKVDLPDEHIAKMLDWDKGGASVWKSAVDKYGSPSAASDALRAQGIPGIRYLDGGSRNAGTGTSNFVVFPGNESLLKILERNGAPVTK